MQKKFLHQAFLDGFSYEDLRQLLYLHLNEKLEQISGPGDQRKVVLDLLEWAESTGRLLDLVDAAREERPHRPEWQTFLQEIQIDKLKPAGPGLRSPVSGLAYNEPYPFEEGFTGRTNELAMLDSWLANGTDKPLLVVIALGGEGKSALAWYWQEELQAGRRRVNNMPELVIWWNFYAAGAGPREFLEQTLTYFGVSSDGKNPRQHLNTLYQKLQQKNTLLLLDGAERILRAYSGMNAAYEEEMNGSPNGAVKFNGSGLNAQDCVDPVAEILLHDLANMRGVKTLITTRLIPRAFYGRGGGLLAGVRLHELAGLDPDSALQLFISLGIKTSRPEVVAIGSPLEYHPLSLRLLAGYAARHPADRRDLRAAADYDPTIDLMDRRQHILFRAYEILSKPEQHTLSTLAAFRSSVSWNTYISVFGNGTSMGNHFRLLVERGLLQRTGQQALYDMHPIVRRYAYQQLADPKNIHNQLVNYFQSLPVAKEVRTLADLQPAIECYHHLTRSGRYDEAFHHFRNRLYDHLYNQLGAYQQVIVLLNALIPINEKRPAYLTDENDQAWTLIVLANSYNLTGRPQEAVEHYEQQITIGEEQGDMDGMAIGLINLAYQQISIGKLADADKNIGSTISLCQAIENRSYEAIGHREWGRLKSYCGNPAGARVELDTAMAQLEKSGDIRYQSSVWAYITLVAMLNHNENAANPAQETARKAYQLAEESARANQRVERNIIQALWLIGWTALAGEDLDEAQKHLDEALRRCRLINLVDLEPAILLAHARLALARADTENAGRYIEEAIRISERAGYVLDLADIHNFLARLALMVGDPAGAREHAQKGYEYAWCDGPPFAYQSALDKAERLLAKIDATF